MIFALPFFVLQLVSIGSALFYTLRMRPTTKKIFIGIFLIVGSSILYNVVSIWFGWLFFFLALASALYFHTKERRIFLDISMLAIASAVSENLAVVIRFSIFTEQGMPVVSFNIGLFLLFFVFFTYLYRFFLNKVWERMYIPVISQFILISIACMTVGVLYINLFISLSQNLYYPAMFNLIIEVIYFLIMFVLSVLLLRNVKKENMLKQKETERKQLHDYMNSLERINRDMQRFRHDYKNILLTMQGYINEDNLEGLKKYFNERIIKVEERTLKSNYLFNQLDHLNLVELKGLLATKVLIAEESNIAINIEVPDTIESIEMNIIDLTRIIGIMIDNAMEASVEMDGAQVNIALLKRKDDSVLIVIENHVNPMEIDIDHIFEPNYSTKKQHRGMGLSTVRKIIENYQNITMNTRIENDYFIHELDIHVVDEANTSSAFY